MTQKKQWKDLSSGQRASVIATGVLQLALAAAAWTDLAKRPAKKVNGKKGVWAAIIAINWVGPIAYFVKGRRTS